MYCLIIDCMKKRWYKHRFGHRANVFKPAIEYKNGDVEFLYRGIGYKVNRTEDYIETIYAGQRHSIRSYPAVIYDNGTKEWYHYDCLHRVNFPAVEYSNGDYEFWDDGKRYGITSYCGKQYLFNKGEFVKCIS